MGFITKENVIIIITCIAISLQKTYNTTARLTIKKHIGSDCVSISFGTDAFQGTKRTSNAAPVTGNSIV